MDGSDDDLRRLLSVAEVGADMARRAFRRVGVREGWSLLECGCGPLGGLAVLADLVGVSGRVVGIDFSEPTLERARSVVARLGLDTVRIVAGEVHDVHPVLLGGPFDLAHTRLFLMRQADPAHTLRRIASLLRPGGWIVAQEPLRAPPLRSYPPLPALGA